EAAAGGQPQRELVVELVHRWGVLEHGERRGHAALDGILLPQPAVQVRRLQPVLGEAGPLDALVLLQPGIGHAGVDGGERAQLVPDLLGAVVVPVVAEPASQLAHDPYVVARLTGRVEGLAHPLYPALGVGEGALALAPRGA